MIDVKICACAYYVEPHTSAVHYAEFVCDDRLAAIPEIGSLLAGFVRGGDRGTAVQMIRNENARYVLRVADVVYCRGDVTPVVVARIYQQYEVFNYIQARLSRKSASEAIDIAVPVAAVPSDEEIACLFQPPYWSRVNDINMSEAKTE